MNGSKPLLVGLCAVALPWLLAGSTAVRADEEQQFDRTPRDCVQTQSIRRTEIVDDQTIIFFMRGKNSAYRNYLPKKCPGLKRWDRFGYQVTAGRLCSIDLITVLERSGASAFGRSSLGGFEPGFTCRLGPFLPMSPEDIESHNAEKAGGAGPNAVKARPVDVGRAEKSAPPVEDQKPETKE